MFDLYKTYNKAKDVFVRPKLKVSFGRWRKMSGLPVWRRGYFLTIAKSHQYYYPHFYVHYAKEKKGSIREDGSVVKYDVMGLSQHRLPNGNVDVAWRSDIRRKLRKWGLGWLKPRYELPIWLYFNCFDYDVIYKWKYDDIRFEYPPQFTLVFFGLALSFTLVTPTEGEFDMQDWYWESLLSYLYQDECEQDISKTLNFCGQWDHSREYGKIKEKTFQLKKHYLKPEHHAEYDEAVKNYKKREIEGL